MKKLLASLLAVTSTFILYGCNKSSSSGNAGVTPTCAVGTIWNGSSCVVNNNNLNVVTSTVQYYDYNYYGTNTSITGSLRIVNTSAYKTFLREALAVCERTILGWDMGLADCSSWTSGSFMISFTVDSSLKPSLRFEANPPPNQYYLTGNIGISGGGAAFNPLILSSGNNTFNLVNASQGFEIRAQGSMYNGGGLRLIQIIVNYGNLAQNEFNYELWYPHNGVATKIATGKFKRY